MNQHLIGFFVLKIPSMAAINIDIPKIARTSGRRVLFAAAVWADSDILRAFFLKKFSLLKVALTERSRKKRPAAHNADLF
ncbi:hypothetical protein [Sediminibacillus albus]|uniref:hypothetical protein n=1 Tax=Sediminibacillus albus TaxID=407036 RepID=UPI000B86DC69|nr:hypothetical protein [Sediminibacillus albus]